MRRITLLFVVIFIAGLSIGGCSGEMFMPGDMKQPSATAATYAATLLSPFSGGAVTPFLEYGVKAYVNADGDLLGKCALYPLSITRFEINIETYNINQEFSVNVDFPDLGDFPVFAFTVQGPMENAKRTPIGDNGRGPAGIVTIPVAAWAPGQVDPDLYAPPTGQYTFKFVVTDASGRNAFCEALVIVVERVVEVKVV